MADVVLFHHVQGLTDGVLALAEALRAPGRQVHAPDLFGGERPATVADGVALVQSIGEDVLRLRVDSVVAPLPPDLVYAGVSWGAAQAQRLAQTRPGARGALLCEACLPVTGEWAVGPWPGLPGREPLPVQVHGMDADEFFALEGDLDAARALVAAVGDGRAGLFTYPGDAHLFTDASLPSSDPAATALVVERSRAFLDRWA